MSVEEAEAYAAFVRERYPEEVAGMSLEEIGWHLIRTSTSGPRLWCGRNILRGLGPLREDHGSLQ